MPRKQGSKWAPACYKSHPALEIGGGTLVGGNCHTPAVETADVYVGLDRDAPDNRPMPWDDDVPSGPLVVACPIRDRDAPRDPESFRRMVEWLARRLEDGLTVHVGCIGGHGRTGMVVAALLRYIDGEEDAIARARELYCHKAVESKVQVDFLVEHWGVKPAPVSDRVYHGSAKAAVSSWFGDETVVPLGRAPEGAGTSTGVPLDLDGSSIWGEHGECS